MLFYVLLVLRVRSECNFWLLQLTKLFKLKHFEVGRMNYALENRFILKEAFEKSI